MKLIVGLGNPGQQYEKTRHNVGATMLKKFLEWEKVGELKYNNKRKSEMLITSQFGDKVIFCFPQTYMNLSGESVLSLVQFYKISADNILILHDEIDFVVGRIAIKKGGSAAGHNGLRSIISRLGTNDFWRIRIGVGRPINSDMVADYVLSEFKLNEKEEIENQEELVFQFIKEFLAN